MACLLRLSRSGLRYRMQRYGVTQPDGEELPLHREIVMADFAGFYASVRTLQTAVVGKKIAQKANLGRRRKNKLSLIHPLRDTKQSTARALQFIESHAREAIDGAVGT